MRKKGVGITFCYIPDITKRFSVMEARAIFLPKINLSCFYSYAVSILCINKCVDRLTHKTQESLPWPHNS